MRRLMRLESSELHPTKRAHRVLADGSLDRRRIAVQNRIRSTLTGTRSIDKSVHVANRWLKELMEILGWDNRERALTAYRAFFHALRDILPVQESVHLGSQLPLIFKGVYYDGWHIRERPIKLYSIDDFYMLVREKLGCGSSRFSNETIVDFSEAILSILTAHVSHGEMRDVRNSLNRRIRNLIPLT